MGHTKFDIRKTGIFKSWCYVSDSAREDFRTLAEGGQLCEEGGAPVIWQTSQKYVLKVTVSGRSYVYKSYRKIRNVRKYLLRLSPCGLEALNYQRLTDLGLPMAELAAVGEERGFLRLKKIFFMTRFAEGFSDGRDFMPGGGCAGENALKEEYIGRNLRFLARCHDGGYLHGGFLPANLLWARRGTPGAEGERLDLLWIDVATCRKIRPWTPAARLAWDAGRFLLLLGITEQAEKEKFLHLYYNALQKKRFSFEKLFRSVCALTV